MKNYLKFFLLHGIPPLRITMMVIFVAWGWTHFLLAFESSSCKPSIRFLSTEGLRLFLPPWLSLLNRGFWEVGWLWSSSDSVDPKKPSRKSADVLAESGTPGRGMMVKNDIIDNTDEIGQVKQRQVNHFFCSAYISKLQLTEQGYQFFVGGAGGLLRVIGQHQVKHLLSRSLTTRLLWQLC